ncbi:nuclear transport factor 2 family protein [Kineococcus rhizosphaerae]|uniref:Uncharacterized protein (TIGR02246 family) n=1 Tax=Kineococcus rhizosphaerae TaxID=559628 RepID=A0A2T0R3L5_9ACTN|nr:nuclear transport factor 2 family protein [Kineococcus rhizosphaerae]PRY14625.1 uncharacterized protein (TIGR02246 family) [Kineococcus rhizosphaerae]
MTATDGAPEPTDALDAAADALVRAFATGDLDAYFASFAPDATFVFPDTGHVLASTQEYRDLWAAWVADGGFEVVSCVGTDRSWQLLGDSAVMVHRVATRSRAGGRVRDSDERETIVFARRDGAWLAVHEHLSTVTP